MTGLWYPAADRHPVPNWCSSGQPDHSTRGTTSPASFGKSRSDGHAGGSAFDPVSNPTPKSSHRKQKSPARMMTARARTIPNPACGKAPRTVHTLPKNGRFPKVWTIEPARQGSLTLNRPTGSGGNRPHFPKTPRFHKSVDGDATHHVGGKPEHVGRRGPTDGHAEEAGPAGRGVWRHGPGLAVAGRSGPRMGVASEHAGWGEDRVEERGGFVHDRRTKTCTNVQ
jgi:hypothetical protein